VWYTPAERNHFTGEPIMKIIRVQKTTIGEGTAAIGVVIHPIKVVAMMIEGSVTVIVVEIEVEIVKVEMTTNVKLPHPRTRKVTIEREATRIIIIGGTIEEIVIATGMKGIGVEIAATGNGIGDTPGTIDQRIDTETSVPTITRKRIARDPGRDRGIALHRHRSE